MTFKEFISESKSFVMPRTSKGDVLIWVDTDKFDELFKKDDGYYIGKGGSGQIHGRYEGFQEFFSTHNEIEVPQVFIGIPFGGKTPKASFTNGRHRYAVLRDIGYKAVPVAVPRNVAVYAQSNGLTSSWRP